MMTWSHNLCFLLHTPNCCDTYHPLSTDCTGGDSAVVSVSVDGQTIHGGSAAVIVYSGGTSQVAEMCRPEKSGECFDCCQGFNVSALLLQ